MVQHKNITLPVETNSEYFKYGIIISVIVILVILALASFIYIRSRKKPNDKVKSGNFTSDIHNTTDYHLLLTTKSDSTPLRPRSITPVTIFHDDDLKVEGITITGSKLNFVSKIKEDHSDIYITEGGIGYYHNTNIDTTFINHSSNDVIFALVSKYGGMRFPTTVPANSSVSNVAVMKGQKWHVVEPKQTQKVLSEIMIGIIPNTISFDGKKLIVQ